MSLISIASKYVELQANNVGVVLIKNVKTNSSSQAYPILFKVKTNLQQFVDVRPSFGVLPPDVNNNSVALNIKYVGGEKEVQKAKLQINWITVEQDPQIINKKFHHSEFNQYFKNAKKISEGSFLLPFAVKNTEKNIFSQKSIQKQEHQQSVSISKDSEIQSNEQLNEIKSNFKQREVEKDSLINGKIDKVEQKRGVSLKIVLFAVIISMFFGVLLGMKFEKWLNSSGAQTQPEQQAFPTQDAVPNSIESHNSIESQQEKNGSIQEKNEQEQQQLYRLNIEIMKQLIKQQN